jgi:hypothetical protein
MPSGFYKRIRKNWIIRLIVLIILVFSFLVVSDTIFMWLVFSREYKKDLVNIKKCIEHCLVLNNGVFPKSEKELFEKGVLVKRKGYPSDEYQYLLPRSFPPELLSIDPNEMTVDQVGSSYIYLRHFKQFTISYGAEPNEIDASNSKLYHRPTGEQILLISGPKSILLRKKHYEKVSFELYKQML